MTTVAFSQKNTNLNLSYTPENIVCAWCVRHAVVFNQSFFFAYIIQAQGYTEKRSKETQDKDREDEIAERV